MSGTRPREEPLKLGISHPCPAQVGDLDYTVTEQQLHGAFAKKYRSILSTKLVIDMSTGLSKGFGFIKFGSEAERDSAMNEMHGQYVGERAIRCTLATTREEREREAKMNQQQQMYDPSRLHAPRRASACLRAPLRSPSPRREVKRAVRRARTCSAAEIRWRVRQRRSNSSARSGDRRDRRQDRPPSL